MHILRTLPCAQSLSTVVYRHATQQPNLCVSTCASLMQILHFLVSSEMLAVM